MSPSTDAIAIICKVPMPDRSKTQLIPRLGAGRAADLSRVRDAESYAWLLDERAGHPPAGLATRAVLAAVGSTP